MLTEGSFVSEICRAEQMWALEGHKHVIPVLGTPNALCPLHLRTLNYRKFPDQERDLLADIDAPDAFHLKVRVEPLGEFLIAR